MGLFSSDGGTKPQAGGGLLFGATTTDLRPSSYTPFEEEDLVERNAQNYANKFFEQGTEDRVREGILESLKSRAETGDQEAIAQYNAVVGDERLSQGAPGIQPQLSNLEKVSTVVASLPGAVAQPFVRSVRGIDQGIRQGQVRENVNKQSDLLTTFGDQIKLLRGIVNDPKASKQRRDNAQKALDRVMQESSRIIGTQSEDVRKMEEAFNNKKNIAAGVELGADLATAGTYGAARRLGTAGARTAAKVGVGTAAGGVVGATTAIQDETDVKRGALIGSAFGATLGLAIPFAKAAGQGVSKASQAGGIPSITQSKFGQNIAQRKTAQKVSRMKDSFVSKVIDDTNLIKKQFKGMNDSTGNKITDTIEEKITNIRQFNALAQFRLQNNQSYQQLKTLIESTGGRKARAAKYDSLGNFIKKKQDAINDVRLGGKSKIPIGTDEQEQAYKLLNESTKQDIQEMFDNGLITQSKYQKWIDDPDYTRVQRETEEHVANQYGGGGLKQSRLISEQRLKGSKKKAIDPFAAYEDWHRRITLESEKNNLAKYLREEMTERGMTKEIRVADKVIKRNELYGEAAQLRPLRNKLGKFTKGQTKYTRQIQKELDKLNKQGLDESLAKVQDDTLQGKLVDPNIKVTKEETRKLMDDLIATESKELKSIRNKIAKKDKKAAEAVDELIELRNQYVNVRDEVSDLTTRARQNADLDPRGENTLKVWENGVREMYTVDPKMAKQLSGMTDLELGAIANWALFPSRILREGATGLNVAFAVPNFVKDQIFSAINSKSIAATHNPMSFLQGIKEAMLKPTGKATLGRLGVGEWKPSKEFSEWLSKNENTTRVDLARNLKKASRESMENLGVKGESPIRKFESVISATEKATRYQNYFGQYKKALKSGKSSQEALSAANRASRENSINFTRRGEMAMFMKIFNPYINAGIQGSARLGRSFKERPVQTATKVATGLMMPVAASTYYNLSDPERAKVYSDLPQWERDSNIIMVIGGAPLKVPLPPGVKDMANPVRNMIESEYLGDRQGFLETAKNMVIDPFSPVVASKSGVMSSLIPQAFKPVVELGMNRDIFLDAPVVPKRLQNELPENQYFESTPQIYRDLGQTFDLSPLQVRKVITGYGAGGLEGALVTLDEIRGENTGNRSTAQQLVGRFVSSRTGGVESQFYDEYIPLSDSRSRVSSQVNKAVKANDMNKANQLANEINSQIESEKRKLTEEYGQFQDQEYLGPLLEKLEKLKINLTDRSISARKRQ